MYYKERKPRKFDFDDEPPKGAGKRAIHAIILLLFLIAVLIFFFPNFFLSSNNADRRNDTDSNAENTELSSAGVAMSNVVRFTVHGS
jgi:hypothetical protein